MASMSMSDLDDREREREHSATGNGNGNGIGDDLKIDAPEPDPDLDLAVSVAGDSVAGNASAATNPRKRKKSSRASVSPPHKLPLVFLVPSMPTSAATCILWNCSKKPPFYSSWRRHLAQPVHSFFRLLRHTLTSMQVRLLSRQSPAL